LNARKKGDEKEHDGEHVQHGNNEEKKRSGSNEKGGNSTSLPSSTSPVNSNDISPDKLEIKEQMALIPSFYRSVHYLSLLNVYLMVTYRLFVLHNRFFPDTQVRIHNFSMIVGTLVDTFMLYDARPYY
jgi:hypothetical protein